MLLNNKLVESISQINYLISDMHEGERAKIPDKVKKFFKKHSKKDDKYRLNYDIPLEDQEISELTKSYLKYIYLYIQN